LSDRNDSRTAAMDTELRSGKVVKYGSGMLRCYRKCVWHSWIRAATSTFPLIGTHDNWSWRRDVVASWPLEVSKKTPRRTSLDGSCLSFKNISIDTAPSTRSPFCRKGMNAPNTYVRTYSTSHAAWMDGIVRRACGFVVMIVQYPVLK